MQEGVLLSWCGGGARRAREDTNASWLSCDDELTAFCWDGILLFFFLCFEWLDANSRSETAFVEMSFRRPCCGIFKIFFHA